jgi:hypothetical protein
MYRQALKNPGKGLILRHQLAARSSLSSALARVMARDDDHQVIERLVERSDDPEMLSYLSTHPATHIRASVANRDATGEVVLRRMAANDESKQVRQIARRTLENIEMYR